MYQLNDSLRSMQCTEVQRLVVSMPKLEPYNGELRVADEDLREATFRLLKEAYRKAVPSFDREKLRCYPMGTRVFIGHIGGKLVTTTAVKNAVDRRGLDKLLETDPDELEGLRLVARLKDRDWTGTTTVPVRWLGDEPVARLALEIALERSVDLVYPTAVAARAGNLPGYRGVNMAMRYRVLEYLWRAGFQAQAGLNADPGLQRNLEQIGYESIPIEKARFIFPGPQRVSWLQRNRFPEVGRKLKGLYLDGRFVTQWDDATRQKIALLGGDPW
jgi:hypothetical protein